MQNRKTKIICTIGPATFDYEIIKRMALAGMNIARINMSHGDRISHKEIIKKIHKLNEELSWPLSILLDTQGPEIRTGEMDSPMQMDAGELVVLYVDKTHKPSQKSILVNYPEIIKDLYKGAKITLDNGLINLLVMEKSEKELVCEVVDGGVLESRKHVNLPGIKVKLPSITEKDKSDILFGVENGVDFIALSFVREPGDMFILRKLIQDNDGHAQIIAKVEDREAVNNLNEIIEMSDGIMIARGDLGVEIEFEELPIIQRRIIKECATRGKRVIVATHLLESMTHNPTPTRAEITDVANAVYEEADAIMLSAETASGKYPVKCVEMFHKIASRIEKTDRAGFVLQRQPKNKKEEMAKSAAILADSLKAPVVIVITRRGTTANDISSFHPYYATIHAFTNMPSVIRKLNLNRGVIPHQIDFSSDPEETIVQAIQILKNKSMIAERDQVVILSDMIAGRDRVETIQIREVK
ncbi:MAG: pyruvate kinase [Spirochaetia bacterium]|nr:pyruvate kinase [Spirochaetia bacterium]